MTTAAAPRETTARDYGSQDEAIRAAGATHFLASQDGVQWLPCHTTDEVETEAA